MPEPRPRLPPSDRDALRPGERAAFVAVFGVLLALRVLHVFRQVFDTDEPQHLHVAWAWIQGLVPYRDVFDDHAPLFHLLSAPLVALVGERAEILFVARLAMLPLFAGILWLVQDIGRRAFGRRTGLWAAAFFAFYPEPFIVSLEFRTDVLWTLFWLLALRTLLAGPPEPKRLFRAGLWFGAAVGTSQKSALLAVALTVAALALLATSREARGALRSRRPVACLAAWTGGALVVPLALVVLFAALGALDDLAYGVVGYGRAVVRVLPSRPASNVAAAVLGFAAAVGAAAWIARRPWALATRIRTSVLVLLAAAYAGILLGYWPLHARQTWLPFQPLVALIATPLFLTLVDRTVIRRGGARAALVTCLVAVVVEGGFLETRVKPWRDRASDAVGRVADTLRLTDPSDLVLDAKGETVFRRRPVREIYESVHLARIERGAVEDGLPEALVSTRTCVAVAKLDRFPPRPQAFLESAYVVVGRLRVAGTVVGPPTGPDDAGPIVFDLAIPARYALLLETGEAVRGDLDGLPYLGQRELAAGRHELRRTAPTVGHVACVWAQAVERGFSPFTAARR